MSDWCYSNPWPYSTLCGGSYGGLWPRVSVDVQAFDARPVEPAPDGQQRTGEQRPFWRPQGLTAAGFCIPGLPPAPEGDYPVWEAMDADSTNTVSRAVITAPIREAGKSYEAREGTPDEWVKLVQSAIDPLWSEALREGLTALSMGFKPFEAVFDRGVRFGQQPATVLFDLVPLSQRLTRALARNGKFAGIRNSRGPNNQAIDLSPEACFVFTVGGLNRDVYGTPWHENCREDWWSKLHVLANLAKLNKKASGIQAIGYYPPGEDSTGKSNEVIMQGLLKAVQTGDGAVIPNAAGLLDPDLAADYRNIKGMAAATLWQIQFQDHGSTGPDAMALLQQLQYWNAQLSRGWHVPERTSQEGQHGTKAEAEAHGDIARAMSQLVFNDFCAALSRGPIDTMLVQNYGERARGAVWVTAGKLRDVYAEGDWRLIDAVLRQPDLFMAVAEQVDLDAVFTRRGIPKVKSVLSLTEAVQKAREAREASQKAKEQTNGKPVNGNGRLLMSHEDHERAEAFIDGFAMLGRMGKDE